MKFKDALTGLFLVALVAAGAYVWLTPSGLTQAPDVSLQIINGEEVTLASFKGRPVLVNFWATTCPGCIEEMPHLFELHEELSPRGFEIIGVAMAYDPPNQVWNLMKAKAIPYPIALDLDSSIANGFGEVRLTPTSFLISPEGKIVKQKIGEMDIAALRQQIIDMLDKPGVSG